MKDIQSEDRYWSYDEVLESMEYRILLEVSDDDYQGDTRVIVQDGDKYGILIFGWGSCSGCDALQACSSVEDVYRLRDDLNDGIQWFDTALNTLEHIKQKDWEASFLGRDKTKDFVQQSVSLLEKIIYHESVDREIKKL